MKNRKILLLVGLAAAVLLPHLVNRIYFTNILITILFYAFLASAWNIICGYIGDLSLGHCVFVGLGGYVSSMLFIHYQISPWIGMLAGMAVSVVVAVIISFPCFRLRGPYFTLTTIAFAELIRIYITNTETGPFGLPLNGAMGLLLTSKGSESVWMMMLNSKTAYYYIMLVFLIIAVIISYSIKKSRLGYYLTAIKNNPNAAESLGINITKYKLIAMIISAALCACAGTFYAQYYRYINAERIFGHDIAVQIALFALIGGQGTVIGPVIGALILVPVSEFLLASFGGTFPGFHLFVYGIIMILVILFLPKGLIDLIDGGKLKLKSRLDGAKLSKIVSR